MGRVVFVFVLAVFVTSCAAEVSPCPGGDCSDNDGCDVDSDCPDGFVCSARKLCLASGACVNDDDCATGHCADGACVDDATCDADVVCVVGCHAGARRCVDGVLGACDAAAVVDAEVCGNGVDDDCVGGVDDGCAGEGEGEGEGEGDACDPVVGRPDAQESNDSCAACFDLGVDPDVTIEGTWDIVADVDYFCFTAVDDDAVEAIAAELDVPAGMDLDLRLYRSVAACEAGDDTDASVLGAGAAEHVAAEDGAGDDGGVWVIAVEGFGTPSCVDAYELHVSGLR